MTQRSHGPWRAGSIRGAIVAFAVATVVLALAACGSNGSSSARNAQPTVVIALVDSAHPPRTAVPVVATAVPGTPTPAPQQLCLVSPTRGIPESYVPPDLVTLPQGPYVGPAVLMRQEAAAALMRLLDGAAAQKIYLFAVSGYRSAELQKETLDNEIKLYGPERAYSEVALPGHSEHQLGDAVDVLSKRDPVDMDDTFGDSPEGQWLAANAPAYGFVISYPKGSQPITGYIYEPWHIRYVGLPLSQAIAASGLTLTEYLPKYGMDGCPLQNGLLTPTPAAGTAGPTARPPR